MANINFNDDMQRLRNNLHNHTEDIVIDYLESMLKEPEFSDACTCDKCLLDMATFALNRLPAKYITSERGDLHAKLEEFEQQVNVDFIQTMARAIDVVSDNPHNKQDYKFQNKNSKN